jgi:cysteine-rich repeat protein
VELSALGEGQALRVQGTNAGHAQQIQPSCAAGSGGREVVYRYVPVLDGTLELQVESSSLLVVSAARMPCATDADAGAASELGCELVGRSLQLAVRSGESVYVIVDGRDEGDEGPYALTLRERSVECGNGFREAGEACDDGNANDSDGCTTQCVLNATEAEPNDTIAEANDYENPFYGAIEPSNDVDVVRFEIVESSDVALRVIDLGDGACEDGRMDPRIRVYDENDAVVGEDDDGGSGFCSELRLDAVAAGAYHAEISRVSLGAETFPYRLTVTMAPVP